MEFGELSKAYELAEEYLEMYMACELEKERKGATPYPPVQSQSPKSKYYMAAIGSISAL